MTIRVLNVQQRRACPVAEHTRVSYTADGVITSKLLRASVLVVLVQYWLVSVTWQLAAYGKRVHGTTMLILYA